MVGEYPAGGRRRALRRNAALAADAVLGRAERLAVHVAGGRRFHREGRDLDPDTGRSSSEALERRSLTDTVWPMMQEALDDGADEEKLISGIRNAIDETGVSLADALSARAPQMLRDHRAVRRGMHRRMRACWGPAFDAFYGVYVCAEELASDLSRLHGGSPHADALLALHARTCLVLGEVHALMNWGFLHGAWARTRSLYETAVVASVLAEYGRDAGTGDLAERFLAHAVIDELKDLKLAKNTGLPVDEHRLRSAQAERDAAVQRYGTPFKQDFGWARVLFPGRSHGHRVTLPDLEDLVDAGLDRLAYKIGNHHIHASAWTTELNVMEHRGQLFRVTGPTNIGFEEPASVALSAAVASMDAVVHSVSLPPDPMHLTGAAAVRVLSDRAVALFLEGAEVVAAREARVLRRTSSGGTGPGLQ